MQIRLKRLAKLQGTVSSNPSPAASTSSTPPPPIAPAITPQKSAPPPSVQKRPAEPVVVTPSPVPLKRKAPAVTAPAQLDLPVWEDETVSSTFNVTLKVRTHAAMYGTLCLWIGQKEVAEMSGYEVVWLKNLAEELQGEGMSDYVLCCTSQHSIRKHHFMLVLGLTLQLNAGMADRTLIARLELDPQTMS